MFVLFFSEEKLHNILMVFFPIFDGFWVGVINT